jgi:hypothetical protein
MNRPLPNFTTQAQAKFWIQVQARNKLLCWEWYGHKDDNGYGRFSDFLAHRIAYYLWFNKDPLKAAVCHTCDNPSCCNPYHLWLGTNKDNTADKVHKNRQAKGVNLRAKLTEDDVRAILSIGYTQTLEKTAAQFGVNHRTISAILLGKTWKHISQEIFHAST